MPCEHDGRFKGVMGCKNGCVACELEKANDLNAELVAACHDASETMYDERYAPGTPGYAVFCRLTNLVARSRRAAKAEKGGA